MTPLELGNRLRERREYLGFTQEEVARKLQVTQSVISKMEGGDRQVTAVELATLAALYGVGVGYLVDAASGVTPSLPSGLLGVTDPADVCEMSNFAEYLRWRQRKPPAEPLRKEPDT